MKPVINGDANSFDINWNSRVETFYTHWTRGEPVNQIQLAFRNHWTLFNQLMLSSGYSGGRRVLEVGSGRGSLSCYFSDAGYDCSLLDLSPKVTEVARSIFDSHGLKGTFDVGDACQMKYPDGTFDLVFSIGLLEHFEEIEPPLQEQIRVLAPGGLFIAYVVPKYNDNIQKNYSWINELIKGYTESSTSGNSSKEDVFRSDAGSERYLPVLKGLGLRGVGSSGVYPLPMISHSIEFPFSLMPERSELALVRHFQGLLRDRMAASNQHPWLCQEGVGQAFIVWGVKN